MNWSTIWSKTAMLGIICLLFLTGWLVGNRSWISSTNPSSVRIREYTGAESNVLGKVKTVALFFRASPQDTKLAGNLLYINIGKDYQVFVNITTLSTTFTNQSVVSTIPLTLNVYASISDIFSNSTKLQKLGETTLELTNSALQSKFPSNILIPTGSRVDRILLTSDTPQLVPSFELAGIPQEIVQSNPPIVWSDPL